MANVIFLEYIHSYNKYIVQKFAFKFREDNLLIKLLELSINAIANAGRNQNSKPKTPG